MVKVTDLSAHGTTKAYATMPIADSLICHGVEMIPLAKSIKQAHACFYTAIQVQQSAKEHIREEQPPKHSYFDFKV